MNHKFVNINFIIDSIKRGNIFKEISNEACIGYAVDCYRLINSEKAEVTKPYKLEIKNYRGILPEDFERIVSTLKVDANLKCSFIMKHDSSNLSHVRHCLGSPDLTCTSKYSYSLNNNYIHTNFEEGFVFMVYKGLNTDCDGNLLIPDNVNVKLAFEYYIKWKFLEDLGSDDAFLRNERVYNEQQYCWYIGKAQSAMTNFTMDEYQSFANSMSKFFDTDDHYNNFFEGLGSKEYIKNQTYG